MTPVPETCPAALESITNHPRGSGNDQNSDTRRLENEDNLQDKTDEDSFPASDPPSQTPIFGVGRAERKVTPQT